MARFRIEVLGQFRLIDLQTGNPIQLRSYSNLLALLALKAPHLTSRPQLVDEFFGEVDSANAKNRLRVALTRFRQQLPGVLVETPHGLTIDLEVAETDISEYRKIIQDASDTADEEDELDLLVQAVRLIGSGGLFGSEISFERLELAEVSHLHYHCCSRAAEIALRLSRFGVVEEIASIGLKQWPDDVSLWKVFLEASISLGQGTAALRTLRSLRDRELISHEDIAPLVSRVSKSEALDAGSGVNLTQAEAQLAVEIVKALLDSNQGLARSLLCSPETLTLAGTRPRQMRSLLERVVGKEPRFGDEHWERCMARLAGLRAWLNDAKGVLEVGELLVSGSQNPIILRAIWNAIGVAHSLRCDWPNAMAAVEKTVHFAREFGTEIDVLSAEGNRAFYLFLQGEFEEADREYERTLTKIRGIGTPQAEFEVVIGSGNRAYIPAAQGDWTRASTLLEEMLELRTSGKTNVAMGALYPCLAMVRMMLGSHEGVVSMTRQGFLYANESESMRSLLLTFEYAACTLSKTDHKTYARSVIDWVLVKREQSDLPRAQAEKHLLGHVFSGVEPEFTLPDTESFSSVGRGVLSRLRKSLA